MISPRVWRRAHVAAGRSLRAAQTHCLTLVSAAVLGGLAFLVLSSDAFQDSRKVAPQEPAPRILTYVAVRRDYALAQYAVGLAWTPPSSDFDAEAVASYFNAAARRIPLPRAGAAVSTVPFSVTLPEGTPQETAEALLTAMADAEALGLRFQLTSLDSEAQN